MTEGQWTIETLHEHLIARMESNDKRYEQRFEASQKALELGLAAQKSAVDAALEAQKTAVIKAEVSTEKRFEGVNEFRNTLSDQQRTLIPRSEVEVMIEAMSQRVNAVEKQQDRAQSERQGIKGGWGFAVGVAGLVSLIVSILGGFAMLAK
jgi:hypothetical protein